MNTFVNYLIEVNLGLVFFYVIYWVLLRNENQFGFKRAYLLGSLLASLVFPFISIQSGALDIIPALSNAVPATWLPEIIIYGDGNALVEKAATSSSFWSWLSYTYLTMVAIIFVIFLFRIAELVRLYIHARRYVWKNYIVAESEKIQGVFSFFHFIFLSPADPLDAEEREEILRHEEVHIQKLHSLDIVLINLIGIACWFNPIIRSYKKSLVQIHEFEADARSVEGRDVNLYCGLLAKVALQSHGYVLANHFTNSFTLKRITMMKTVRKKISQWKVVTISVTALLIFFVVACQDQVMQDIQTITDNSSTAIILPPQVETELTKLKQTNPKAEFIVMEMNDEGKRKLEEIEKDEAFKKMLVSIHVIKTEEQSFVILEKGEQTNRIADMTMAEGEVFTIVEESAEPKNGMEELWGHFAKTIKYPVEARQKGIEGRVFVQFIVNTDGSISDVEVIKGIGGGCDEEAAKVVALAPPWNPGKQKGQVVRQRMVIPVIFKLSNSDKKIEGGQASGSSLNELVVVGHKNN
ncbi:MAG TPA: M56 family metallopeptidase [Cyclobacteriaceae bacterium]|nr:M56 family metallopeptidase [Cyclobacteriaceae bacterium]